MTQSATRIRTYTKAFHHTASASADELALCHKAGHPQKLTYRELAIHSDRAAARLRDAGCQKGMVVPLLMSRGMDIVIWALAVIKTGAAVAPLAEDIPLSRAEFIIKDTNAPFVVAHPHLAKDLGDQDCLIAEPDGWESETTENQKPEPPADIHPDDPMVVFYTSGTTGQPKGVVISHQNVTSFSLRHSEFNRISRGTRICSYATASFDAFIVDVFAPLISGARVYILDKASRMSIVGLHQYLMRHKLEVIFLTTRLGEAYMTSFDNPHLRRLLTGGEVLRKFTPRQYEIFNLYGPTETTAYVTGTRILSPMEDYPLGKSFPGMRVMVLNKENRRCGPGEKGEICISGSQVSPGYLNRPQETAKAFTANPLYDDKKDRREYARLYRTGDLGETDTQGNLFFRGRIDNQIKIRGFRIEPGEIEAEMLRYPGLEHACVRPWVNTNEETCLIAYFSRKPLAEENLAQGLKAHLKASLPGQMVPRYIMELNHFPLNANGKVDGSQLPQPDGEREIRT